MQEREQMELCIIAFVLWKSDERISISLATPANLPFSLWS
jgi:hypothetical protein